MSSRAASAWNALRDRLDRAAGLLGDRDDVGRLHQLRRERVGPGDVLGHALRDEVVGDLAAVRAPLVRADLGQHGDQPGERRLRGLDVLLEPVAAVVVEVPARGRLHEPVDAEHQLGDDAPVGAARQALDGVPARAGAGDLARDPVGARRRRPASAPRSAASWETNVGPSELTTDVRVDHRDQLAPQRMLGEQVAEALDDAVREVLAQVALQPRVLAEVRRQQVARERPLGVGEQQRQLGPLEPAAAAPALGDLLGPREPLGLARQQPGGLQRDHQVLVGVHAPLGDDDLLGQDLRLQEGVVEHVLDDVVGDLEQQLVARRRGRARRGARRARAGSSG